MLWKLWKKQVEVLHKVVTVLQLHDYNVESEHGKFDNGEVRYDTYKSGEYRIEVICLDEVKAPDCFCFEYFTGDDTYGCRFGSIKVYPDGVIGLDFTSGFIVEWLVESDLGVDYEFEFMDDYDSGETDWSFYMQEC